MPSLDLLISFAAATAVFAYMPGPALLYAAARTLSRGRQGGLIAALGIHIGGYAHVLAAAVGLSAMLSYVPELYFAVKLIGAAYLVWLGIGMLITRGAAGTVPKLAAKSARRAFIESVTAEVLNPKVAVFYVAFLPQFVDPASAWSVPVQFLVLGVIVNMAFSSADVVTVFLAARLRSRVARSGPCERLVRWCGGSILVGLGVRLTLSKD